jgi:hypothetical protein
LSEVRANTISAANGTDPVTLTKQAAAKAYLWHAFSTTIQDSFNISSVTDGGTGQGRADFTSSMGNAYPIINHNQMGGAHNTTFVWNEATSQTASKWEWNTGTSASGGTNTQADNDSTHTVFGDLA